MHEDLIKQLKQIREMAISGPLNVWHVTTVGDKRVMHGPGGSLAVLTDDSKTGSVFEWEFPNDADIGPHWHKFSERLEVVRGGMDLTITSVGTTSMRPGDAIEIDPYRPHHASVEAGSCIVSILGPGSRVVEAQP